MSKPKVLFVDDEPNVLDGIRRSLRNEFDVHTATSGQAALEVVAASGPFSVIVCDCRMPEMDGIELLRRLTVAAPLSVRVMLTGNMDQETAVKAVNTGDVFKFLNKPCDSKALKDVVALAVRQFELVTAEKELLEKTLKGSIAVLSDLLGIVKPEAFGRTARLRRRAREVAKHFPAVRAWELDAAALLSQLGCISVEQAVLEKLVRGDKLNEREAADYAAHPLLGADLISRIPRLERVANIILYQNKRFDGRGFPVDETRGAGIPLEARVLHGVLVYDDLHTVGRSHAEIIEKLRHAPGDVDPAVIEALNRSSDGRAADAPIRLLASELQLGMIIQEDVKTDQGVMLLCHGQEVTTAIREHLVKFQELGSLTKRILVAAAPRSDAVDGAEGAEGADEADDAVGAESPARRVAEG